MSKGGGESRKQTSNTIRTNYSNGYSNETYIGVLNKGASQHYRIYDEGGVSPTLQSQSGWSSQKHPFIRQKPRGKNKGKDFKIATTVSKSSWQDNNHLIVPTVRANAHQTADTHYIHEKMEVRRLMPIEVEKVMGWPAEHTKFGLNEKGERVEISDSQRYKMAGNGCVPQCVEWIVENVIKNPPITK